MDEKDTQSRGWILTLPADDYDKDMIMDRFANYCFEGQKEVGNETGYEHWQLWIENKTPIAFSTLRKKFPKGHFEVRRGSKQQAHDYVSKEETSTGETISNGEIDYGDHRGERSDLRAARDALLEGATVEHVVKAVPGAWRYIKNFKEVRDIYLSEKFMKAERDIQVHYVYGEPGVGKTRMIFDRFKYEDVYRVNSYRNPFDTYNSENVLVLDEFYGQINMEQMLNILDRYPLRLPARYNDRVACFSEVFIISNVPLSSQYLEIQNQNPQQWKAFLRRIDSVERMEEGGFLVDDSCDVASVF